MRGVRSGRLCYLRISVSRKTLSPPSSEFLCLRFLLALLMLRVMLPLRATVSSLLFANHSFHCGSISSSVPHFSYLGKATDSSSEKQKTSLNFP